MPLTETPLERRQRLLQRMAWVCAVMVLCITSLSAYLRLSKAGLGCEPWPQCYGQALQTPAAEAGGAEAAARLAHRVIASAALVLVLLMVLTALGSRPALGAQGRMALVLLGLALFLAVLGRWTAQSRLPAVTLGNLLGGFAMVAVSVRLALAAGRPGGAAAPLAPWAWLAAALLLAQAALGGLVSAGHAGLSCPAWGACDLSAGTWQALHPWVEPAAGLLPTQAGGALVHLLHRSCGLALVALLLVLAWRARRAGRRGAARLLVLLPLVQVALGLGLVGQGLPLALALAHNLVAALLLALLLGLTLPPRARALSPAL